MGADLWRGALKVIIAAPPISGQANKELIAMMDSLMPEARGAIALVKGSKSHSKVLFIPVKESLLRKRLGLEDDQ